MTDGVPGLQVLVFPIVYFLFYYYGMSLVLERRNGVELLTGRGYYLPVSGFQLQIRMSRNKWKKKEWQRKQSQDLITPGPFNRTSLPSFLMHVESSFPFVDHHLSSLFLTASSPIISFLTSWNTICLVCKSPTLPLILPFIHLTSCFLSDIYLIHLSSMIYHIVIDL